MRYRAKRDENHGQIVKELEACGLTVLDLAAVGKGAPDICVGHGGKNYLFEIIGPDKLKRFPPCGRSQNQRDWHDAWRGQVCHVTSTQEALDAMALGHRGFK